MVDVKIGQWDVSTSFELTKEAFKTLSSNGKAAAEAGRRMRAEMMKAIEDLTLPPLDTEKKPITGETILEDMARAATDLKGSRFPVGFAIKRSLKESFQKQISEAMPQRTTGANTLFPAPFLGLKVHFDADQFEDCLAFYSMEGFSAYINRNQDPLTWVEYLKNATDTTE